MSDPNKPKTDVAEAAAAVVDQALQPPPGPKEKLWNVRGPVFFSLCTYVGSLPLRQVADFRRQLFELQKETNCLAAGFLPPYAALTETTVNYVMNWLLDQPCDAVSEIFNAINEDINNQKARELAAEQAAQAAAQKVIDDAKAAEAAAAAADPAKPFVQDQVQVDDKPGEAAQVSAEAAGPAADPALAVQGSQADAAPASVQEQAADQAAVSSEGTGSGDAVDPAP